MVFNFFKRNKSKIDKKFLDINDSLKNSFFKIKEDMFSLSSHLDSLHGHKKEHE